MDRAKDANMRQHYPFLQLTVSALRSPLLHFMSLSWAALAYAGAALLDPLLGLSDGQPPVIQLRLAVAFALVLLFGVRQIVPVMLCHGLLALLAGMPPMNAAGSALLTGALAAGGTHVLRQYPVQPFPRMRADHYAWFLAVALALSVLHGAVQAWQAVRPFYLSDWTLHAAADFAGLLLLVPVIACWRSRLRLAPIVDELRVALPWMALTLGAAGALFMRELTGPEPYMLVLPAVLVWAAIRIKVRWMSALLLLMNALALVGTLRGLGPFGNETPLRALLLLQTFLITMSIVPYSLSVTLTERANASRRARSREAQLLDLFDGSIQGILIHRQFRPLYANRRAAELLGFQSVADLMASSSLATMVAADDLPVITSESNRRQLASGRILPMQADVIRMDGERRTLDSVIRQVTWDGEAATQATFIDVTDDLRARREQRNRMLRQEKQLMAIMRLSADTALASGAREALRTLTDVAAHALDISRASVWRFDEDARRLSCLDLFDARRQADDSGHSRSAMLDVDVYPRYVAALRQGRTIVANDARTDPTTADLASYLESEGIVAILDAPVFLDGMLAGVVCLEQAGRPRDWAHDEVRFASELATLLGRFLVARERSTALDEQARLLAILDATPDYVSTVDTERNVLYLNLAARRMLGLPDRQLPEHLRVEDLYPPDGLRHYVDEEMPAVHALGLWVGETTLRSRSGIDLPVSAVRLAHRDSTGKVLFVSSVLRDISDQKRNEQALRVANETLEQRVEERTQELAQANDRLKDLDRLKSMFIASMSHELRTPLNSIIGFTGVVLAGMAGELTTRQQDQLQRVYGSARHLLALITDVIDISKIEAGFIDTFEERFEVSAVIDEAVQSVRAAARDKQIDIRVSVPAGVMVQADRRRLLQCVLNLASNAVKYTIEGHITVEARVRGSWLDIIVEDTGIGMDEGGLARLFRPFERIDSQLRVRTPGTGLGLYLTRKIMTELLAGSIEVSSTPGVGSRFALHLPREGSGRAEQGGHP
jgi:PAS domain S-box-containing protein